MKLLDPIGAVEALDVGSAGRGRPTTLGPYTVLTRIASGGMATVYVGNKYGVAGFERLVAIKCCHPHLRDSEEFVTMFLDEARLAARIHHPNVVATLDVSSTDILYLVMDYVEGGSLLTLLREANRKGISPPIGVVIRVMIDALAGLHAAHELRGADGERLNLVHRDVSPHNILVGVDGISRITDFGVAYAAVRSTMTREGKIKGKFSYMAPEQVRGQAASRRTDTFAAGIVLWEALTGRRLFRGADDAATIQAVLGAEIASPSSVMAGLPAAVDAVVLKALKRDPDQRYQTAAELADALEQLRMEQATTRAVAAFVEHVLGAELAQRRVIVREASEQGQQAFGPEFDGSVVRDKLPSSIDIPIGDADMVERRPQSIPTRVEPSSATGSLAQSAAAIDAEHRRMRGLLAAAMLLLVGSAIGLLLARSSATPKEQPESSERRPAQTPVVQHSVELNPIVRPPSPSASSVPTDPPLKR